jgi:hypothetical protein
MNSFAMARLAKCALLTGLFAHVSSQSFKFTNPPSYDSNSGLDINPLYKEGETMDVSWTVREEARLINLALNQVKISGLDSADSSEIIMRMKMARSMAICNKADC